ncbi:hypothetical protein NG798_09365 [Ancylothrix sp. C2]|uniref:hypothetical protein n=1 Tax=Ancylothrix sp. D3o TaxID=2953691 RepID=UPI0021BBA66B|nr:hypothetical protein [Ancylothrix sp. D3o]MCT7949994.1 hypothetical protein [Ancylothrix sp. D3o]
MTLPWGSSLILENSNLTWNLARRITLASQTFLGSDGIERFQPIPSQTGLSPSSVFLVGTSCTQSEGKNWNWGGTFNVYSSFFPDSQTTFTGAGLIYRQFLKINNLNFIVAPKIEGVNQYMWEIQVPKYFKDITLEVFWHDGQISNSLEIKP